MAADVATGMQRWAGRVALVTGASSGIGRATANALVRQNMRVIGCGITVEEIKDDIQTISADSSITGTLHAIQCDLTKEEEILAMFAEIKSKYGGVDVCICNAGVCHAGTVQEPVGILNGETPEWREMLDVNFLAVAICCREAIKQMEQKGAHDGQILVTNSLSGHRLTFESVGLHFYSVTKHALTALVEGIRRELRKKANSIRIAQISPGSVATGLLAKMYPSDDPEKDGKIPGNEPLETKNITDVMLYILQAPPHVQIHDIMLRATEQVD